MGHDHDGGHGIHPFGGRVSRRLEETLSPHSSSRRRSSGDDAYLSYYDVRLTYEDVETLRDDWLTDNVIAFWQEWLEHEVLSKHARCKIVLLRPSMAFMLMQSEDPAMLREVLPDLSETTHIFLPINNNTDPERAEGGSHWSLLLVSIKDRVAFHYDSMRNTNEDRGELATRQLEKMLSLPRSAIKFVDIGDAPQQDNYNDCGVFVCLLMKHLLVQKLLTRHGSEQVNMSVNDKEINARKGRQEMKRIIDQERDEGERRRSMSGRSLSRSKSPPRIGPDTEGG